MNILSIENALSWSWGLCMPDYMAQWGHEVVRIIRQPKIDVRLVCDTCGEFNNHVLDPVRLNQGLLTHFDLCLVQNVDTLPLMDSKENAVCRLGGLVVDGTDIHRYDDVLSQCPAVIATNSFLYGIAQGANGNSFLIPNGCDLEKFKPQERSKRKFTVGFAGNVHGQGMHYKGFKYFSQAVVDLMVEVNHVKRLHAHNQLPHDEMPNFYHSIDCLVLPSLGEGCSNVTMEALACGIPVLTTPVGYHGERLENEVDCLFIQRNADDIKEKILRLKNDPNLWQTLSENGRQFAEEHHDINKIASQYREVFESVFERTNENGTG